MAGVSSKSRSPAPKSGGSPLRADARPRLAGAVDQIRELAVHNRIEYSSITEDQFPGFLARERASTGA